jgi:hypothetical protein
MGSNADATDGIGSANNLDALGSLAPGDVVEIWDGGSLVVKTAFACQETVDGKSYGWRWTFLDDGSLIEASPDGYFWYRIHQVVKQGTDLYEELVAQDGALVRFEERVREGSSGRRPVEVTVDGKPFRLTSTGTVQVQQTGPDPELMPWRSFDRNPESNVYFGLVDVADESNVKLGLWTVHVCLSSGRELGETDVTAVYRGSVTKSRDSR